MISMEMNFTNLGALVDTIIDYRGKTPLKLGGVWAETPNQNYRAFSAKNIKTGKIVQLDEIRYVSPELYQKWMKQEINRGDILITSEAPFGQIFYWDSDEKIVLSQRLFAVRIKPEFYDKYAYYYMTSSGFQGEMKARSTGSTVEGLRQPALLRCNFAYPKYESQKKIATILWNYDQLIENNNKRIQLLENMAESLYKEWFIRFRFPGHETIEFKNGIPNDWEYKKFKEIISYNRGISYSSEEIDCIDGLNLINLKNINSYGGFRRDGIKTYNGKYKVQHIVKYKDLIMGVTDMTQDRRTVGHVALIPDIEGVISADLIRLDSDINHVFIYCLFRYGFYSTFFSQFGNGANVIHLKPESIRNQKILIPNSTLINMFAKYIEPTIDEIEKLNKKNDLLTKQRDSLLPRLMSGKLSVEGKEAI